MPELQLLLGGTLLAPPHLADSAPTTFCQLCRGWRGGVVLRQQGSLQHPQAVRRGSMCGGMVWNAPYAGAVSQDVPLGCLLCCAVPC